MSIWKDLANFGVGAIERDRELTNEKLTIRAEELKANRDLMIAMKKDKYAADIAEYKKEKAKANEIKKLNSVAASGNMDSESYAKQYLLHNLGTEKFNALKDLDPQGFLDMVDNYAAQAEAAKTGLDYKFTIDRNNLDKQMEVDTKIINKGFSKAVEEAKGDSFLINKILNKKSTVDKDVNADITEQLKAAKLVNEETLDTDKKEIIFAKGTKRLRKPPEPYQTEWASQRNKITFDITKDGNAFKFLNLTAKYGGNDDLSYSFNKTDNKIDKMNEPATTNLLAMQYMFNEVKNSDDTMSLHYNTVTKNKGDIGKTWNADTVYKTMSSLLDGRGGNIQEKGFDFKTDYRLTTFVPLSLVNQNNKMEFANGTSIDFSNKSDMKALSTAMNNYIIAKTNTIYSNDKSVSEQGIASKVYERLYTGDSETMKEFLTFAMTNEKKGNPELFKNTITSAEDAGAEIQETNTNTTQDTKTSEKPNDKKVEMKFIVTKQNGKDGIAIKGGKFRTWEELEDNNLIQSLPEVTKLEYDKWKNSKDSSKVKGTSFEEIQKNTDENTEAIKNAFLDSEGNFENMKTNESNIRPFNKG